MHPLAVAVGGAIGTLLRLLATQGSSAGWDYSIAVVNVVGAFLLGLVTALPVRPAVRALLGPGTLGALTSFSALSIAFVDGPAMYAAGLSLVISLLGGVLAGATGLWLGRRLVARGDVP